MRSLLAVCLAVALVPLALASCEDDVAVANPATGGGGVGGVGGAAPTCETELIYDPLAGAVDLFPDHFFTVDDATMPTGLRVHMVPGDNIVVEPDAERFNLIFDDLSTLDGFGTTAALLLQFTAPIDPSSLPDRASSATADSSVLLIAMPANGSPELLPFDTQLLEDSPGDPHTTLIVSPLAPLAPTTEHALVVTDAIRSDSGCVAPSPSMRAMLMGAATEPELLRVTEHYAAMGTAMESLGVASPVESLVAATVFTTQHTTEDSETIAAAIRNKPVSYVSGGPCTDSGGFLTCEGSFTADDYRVMGHHIDDSSLTPQATYSIPVVTYLPKTGTAPFRTIIFGHGLNGDRTQALGVAEFAAASGYAVVAIDAVKHGAHPDPATSGLPAAEALEFFGISLGEDPIDGRKLRDNWRQSTYDKLQLVEMLRPGVDIDGTVGADVGVDDLVYLGVSLGGVMAGEFLAFTPEVKVALPVVPGARVVDIIKDGSQFDVVISLLSGMATDGQIARFFPLLQTIVDRGDAGAYVGHIMSDRLAGFDSGRPQLLMQMVIDDDTVPNSTNLFFARGLGIAHVGDELLPIGVIAHEPTLPVVGNIEANVTAGVFQYDIVFDGTGPATEPATHGNVGRNPISQEQTLHFLESYFNNGVSEIIDPYRTLGVKP
jgi:pimeloyl-ACP methyl ester carboxylesterase